MKTIGYKVIAATGLSRMAHRFINSDQISILMYHGVVDKELTIPDWCFIELSSFRAQMKYLKKHFRVVSLSESLSLLKNGKITSPTAVITFDDGYQNNFDCAYPVLCEENLPATIFLTSSLIDTDSTIWPGVLHNAFSNTLKTTLIWRGKTYRIESVEDKKNTLAAVKAILKKEPYSVLMFEVEEIASSLLDGGAGVIDPNSPYRILDLQSVRKMAESNLIEFGAHTETHPILANLSKREQEHEILSSIDNVESITGQSSCSLFAYPNGGVADYNSDTISILNNSKISAAVTTIEGTCNSKTSLMELNRFGIGSDMNLATFELTVHNVISFFKRYAP